MLSLLPVVAWPIACGGVSSSNDDPAGTGGTAGQAPQDCTSVGRLTK